MGFVSLELMTKEKITRAVYLDHDINRELEMMASQEKIKSVSDFLNNSAKQTLLDLSRISKRNKRALLKLRRGNETMNDVIDRLIAVYKNAKRAGINEEDSAKRP